MAANGRSRLRAVGQERRLKDGGLRNPTLAAQATCAHKAPSISIWHRIDQVASSKGQVTGQVPQNIEFGGGEIQMATGQCDRRHVMPYPIGELIRPALLRRTEECGWQPRLCAAAYEAVSSSLTAEL